MYNGAKDTEKHRVTMLSHRINKAFDSPNPIPIGFNADYNTEKSKGNIFCAPVGHVSAMMKM